MHVLAGEPSVLVSIAAATASRAARLAVCAVMFDVRPTCFKSFVVDTCTPQTLLSQSPVTMLTGNSWLTKRGHKMNVTYVLQGETSLLVRIATTTVSRVTRLAVCAGVPRDLVTFLLD